ncbi:glycosyltransferase [Gloeocapsopsis dulcis]|uniref:Glucosyl transferase n=1 Tax=Gloeocapsopsis dulcis AAB1 = 1H9 TaxID=1433147 RepID=A0A6N8FRQ2_9CHRO|nr:glycosyltransferase [Gloeocapsopsis dulcis]MUL35810.1 glucosyl transferase [Gloeocapsopsis dulcis AAB1 = 1H9]WNN87723.1 glycosyltransferase [Gloeocapsopsis dulcis]
MIFVTVGTEQFPFNRLMTWIQVLIKRGFIAEEVVVQYGSSTNIPTGVNSYSVLPPEQFHSVIKQARIVIGHCGEGTILLLAATAKPYILVPRSQKYKEHIDNHQVELAEALAQLDVPIAWSPGDLVRFLALPRLVPTTLISATSVCQQLHNRFK